MLPSAIDLQNYRSFPGPQRLELRPLTLIYGVNNTGKSSLLRLLPLLGASLADGANGPLNLESPAMFGASFEDLRWRGPVSEPVGDVDGIDEARNGLRITLRWEGDPDIDVADYVFSRFESQQLIRRLLVKSFAVHGPAGWLRARERIRPEEESRRSVTYDVQIPGRTESIAAALTFDGLLPSVAPDHALHGLLAPIRARLAALKGRFLWLQAQRRSPERFTTTPSNPRWYLKYDGSDAAALLATNPEILRSVSEWYERMVQRRLLITEVPPAAFRLQLQHIREASVTVDLLDSGEGMNQVLPVLCALELARSRESDEGSCILALEEPESHLHPRLQQGLVEKIVQTVSNSGSRVLLETHSEHFLLGVQLQIARRILRPEQVAIYWLRQREDGSTVAELSTFDERAFPQGAWPANVFNEDTDAARAVIQARREHAR